ncbi:MAG: hypothetical protein WA919_21680 [Coleofasciculaceae cyanobacterium]
MKKQHQLQCSILTLTSLLSLNLPISAALAVPTVYISDEVGSNNSLSRSQVEEQDDNWRNAATIFGASNFTQNVIPTGSNEAISPTAYPLITTATGIMVDVSLRDLTDADLALPSSLGTAATGNPRLSNSDTLQGSAPRPTSLYDTSGQSRFWNELVGSSSSRNGVLFTFSQPLSAFGAWFGDLETRTDGNGVPALVRLLDANGNRIGEDIVIPSSTEDQSQCVGNFRGCGNSTTRWIGFVDPDTQVKQMLVIVGDDDFGDDGYTEHMSFIGATVGEVAAASLPPELLLVKRITAINGVDFTEVVDDPSSTNDNHPYWPISSLRGVIDGVVLPGDEVEYTIYFLSSGGRSVTNVSICDPIPENTTFLPTAFNGLTPTEGLIGANLGIALALDSNNMSTSPTVYLTNVADGDRGQFFSPEMIPPSSCSGGNNNGTVVVDVVTSPDTLPHATAPGTPANSFGFIRFRTQVN